MLFWSSFYIMCTVVISTAKQKQEQSCGYQSWSVFGRPSASHFESKEAACRRNTRVRKAACSCETEAGKPASFKQCPNKGSFTSGLIWEWAFDNMNQIVSKSYFVAWPLTSHNAVFSSRLYLFSDPIISLWTLITASQQIPQPLLNSGNLTLYTMREGKTLFELFTK